MVNIGILKEVRDNSIVLLNSLLADHFTFLLKVWQFHWNIKGDSFGSYHERMKELYETQIDYVDDTAERIRALGGTPLTSMEAMLQNNHIQEHEGSVPGAMEMWRVILNDMESIIQFIRDIHSRIDSSDLGTLNFLEDMITKMEKDAWMVRALFG